MRLRQVVLALGMPPAPVPALALTRAPAPAPLLAGSSAQPLRALRVTWLARVQERSSLRLTATESGRGRRASLLATSAEPGPEAEFSLAGSGGAVPAPSLLHAAGRAAFPSQLLEPTLTQLTQSWVQPSSRCCECAVALKGETVRSSRPRIAPTASPLPSLESQCQNGRPAGAELPHR